jgi:hypothetical protein
VEPTVEPPPAPGAPSLNPSPQTTSPEIGFVPVTPRPAPPKFEPAAPEPSAQLP